MPGVGALSSHAKKLDATLNKTFRMITGCMKPTNTNSLPVLAGIAPSDIRWGAVAQGLERATDDRVVAGSNPTETAWKLWQFPLPHFARVFRRRH